VLRSFSTSSSTKEKKSQRQRIARKEEGQHRKKYNVSILQRKNSAHGKKNVPAADRGVRKKKKSVASYQACPGAPTKRGGLTGVHQEAAGEKGKKEDVTFSERGCSVRPAKGNSTGK